MARRKALHVSAAHAAPRARRRDGHGGDDHQRRFGARRTRRNAIADPVDPHAARPFVSRGSVAGGQPVTSGSTMTINQQTRTLGLNWDKFNVGSNTDGPLQPARRELARAQPHLGRQSERNLRQAGSQRAGLPDQPERHPLRRGIAGECRRTRRLGVEHVRDDAQQAAR